jgi:hypothetical protein
MSEKRREDTHALSNIRPPPENGVENTWCLKAANRKSLSACRPKVSEEPSDVTVFVSRH